MNPSNLVRLAVIATLFGAPATAQGDEVNLSRYRITAVMPNFSGAHQVLEPVDPAVMDALCEDGDGCTVRLQATGYLGSGLRAVEWVIFKSGPAWTIAGEDLEFYDGDNDPTEPRALDFGSGRYCSLTDLNVDFSDAAAGFSVSAYFSGFGGSTNGFTCLVTLID